MDKHTVIYNGTLIDCRTALPQRHMAVLLRGDRIEAVGPADQLAAPADAQYIDARGKTIMPGMIDAHIHITGDGDPNLLKHLRRTVPEQAIIASVHAKATVEAGFTSIRDAGAGFLIDIGLREAVNAGRVPGPRMKVSGRGLGITGGHGDNFFPPEIQFAGRMVVDSPDEARKAAREQLRAGADCIKILATGGVMSERTESDPRGMTVEEMRAAIDEAKNVGAKTLAHAQGNQGIKNAIIAGIDSIEHGFYLDDEAIEMMIKRDVFMVPTLAAVHQIVVNGEKMGVPPHAVRKATKAQEAHLVSFRKALDAGVKIAMGTDAATPFNYHGNNALELELMVNAGMTPAQALLATTRMGAELLGVLGDLGTVEAGKLADIILVAGDPLADISILRRLENISLVMKGGSVVINRGVKVGCRGEL
jgi:imidazolonepropionase-like amidohydrolase